MDTTYLGKYGQLSCLNTEFLKNSDLESLINLETEKEFLSYLENRFYKVEVQKFSNSYTMPDLYTMIINYHMVSHIKDALQSLPYGGKAFVSAYLNKFDTENIKVILSSKSLNYKVDQFEPFLMINDMPVGYITGSIPEEEYKALMEQPDVEGIVNSLAEYGYGVALMERLEDFRSQGNLIGMFNTLDSYYYTRLFEQFNMYVGSQPSIGNYLRSLVDIHNVSLLAKRIVSSNKDKDIDDLDDFIVDSGSITKQELLNSKFDTIESLAGLNIPGASKAVEAYNRSGLLGSIETEMKYALYNEYLPKLKMSSMGLNTVMYYIIRSEIERDNLRVIMLGKYYDMGNEFIRSNVIKLSNEA
ncbi:A-type Na(+),H(+)-transporting-ATP synthase subunit C [Candidatus Mancarchaeum acidiphilum]|uniref:A-type Na(+),H(+)-transporting-ATP synthase subunit C n=1 Tax=Candidatus Mancarchaeum acidiphilum TaxID=1920749 RepID=A0A218NMH7_9ARCH|nr:V-type ATPase subunit [Candidatus Mancarchaeum acidiphilum]ASI13679.1 A-type Na(+),H(+)-transporting-ATP synthase subunit C [Candidatus Mancarchaeum acidiphilum]